MFYHFHPDEYPFQLTTALRFICKATVMRKQFSRGERVVFSDQTQIRMVVPEGPTDLSIDPYIIASCPVTGSTLRLTVHLCESRPLANRNDAIAYLRRALCKEAIMVTEMDIHNVVKFGSRGHYTREFFLGLIEKYRHRMATFHSYNYSVSYD